MVKESSALEIFLIFLSLIKSLKPKNLMAMKIKTHQPVSSTLKMMFDIFCLSRGHQILNTGYTPAPGRSIEPLQREPSPARSHSERRLSTNHKQIRSVQNAFSTLRQSCGALQACYPTGNPDRALK